MHPDPFDSDHQTVAIQICEPVNYAEPNRRFVNSTLDISATGTFYDSFWNSCKEISSLAAPLFLVGFHAVVLSGGIPLVASISVSSAGIYALQGPIAQKIGGCFTSRRPAN